MATTAINNRGSYGSSTSTSKNVKKRSSVTLPPLAAKEPVPESSSPVPRSESQQSSAPASANVSKKGSFALPTIAKGATLESTGGPKKGIDLVRTMENQPKILNIEGQRILSVLQEAIEKFTFIKLVPSNPDRKLGNILGEENMLMLREFRNAEIKYDLLYEKTLQKVKSESSPTEASKIKSISTFTPELKEESKNLRQLTRQVVRMISYVPNILNKLEACEYVVDDGLKKFLSLWEQYLSLVHEKLQTTVEDDRRRSEQLSHYTAKERKELEEILQLEAQLDKAKSERHAEISKKNEAIRKLKDQLKDIKNQAEETTHKLETKSKQKEESDVGQFKEKEKTLLPEIDTLSAKLVEMQKNHREEEAVLRKKKFKIETEVENWIHKYDQELEEKQLEIEETAAIYKEEKTQLEELEAKFADLNAEYERIQEERRKEAEELKRVQEILAAQAKAATKIQALWRGRLVRKTINRKGAKSAKSNGSGKGKKK